MGWFFRCIAFLVVHPESRSEQGAYAMSSIVIYFAASIFWRRYR